MAKRKIPDEMLTPEQLRRRQRNERYKQKQSVSPQGRLQLVKNKDVLKTPQSVSKTASFEVETVVAAAEFKNDQIEDGMNFTAWKRFEAILENPTLFFTIAFVVVLTSLLVFFQATTYLGEAMNPTLAWAIALTCELSLCYVTVLYSLKKNRFFVGVLFLAFFSYVLGTMTYGIKKSEHVEIVGIAENDSNSKLLRESIRKTQAALDLAVERKESGNVAKGTKALADLSLQLAKNVSPQHPIADLVEARSMGLIFLRALLMLINAIAIHHVILSFRNLAIL